MPPNVAAAAEETVRESGMSGLCKLIRCRVEWWSVVLINGGAKMLARAASECVAYTILWPSYHRASNDGLAQLQQQQHERPIDYVSRQQLQRSAFFCSVPRVWGRTVGWEARLTIILHSSIIDIIII
jgi:hypothetical protein